MSGAKRPRGRPKGTGKAFSTDRDRYVIALTDALLATGVKFEHAAMLAIYFHWRDRIALPVDALHSVRRLGLSVRVQEHLRKGWRLQQWGPRVRPNRDVIGGQVDRIRKKRQRLTADPTAERWRYYMALAWASLAALTTFGSEVIARYVFFAAGGSKRMPGGVAA